ncbi:MAG: iron-sulfur cluster assembly scaffold protein [Patescibacteria group bacterium]
MTDDKTMYREIILDHHKHPRNFGELKDPDGAARRDNPLCGDSVQITYRLDGRKKKVADVKFTGTGCSVTRAGASMLTEIVKGKALAELGQYTDQDFLNDIGVPITPARKKCVLLALVTLRKALGIENPRN